MRALPWHWRAPGLLTRQRGGWPLRGHHSSRDNRASGRQGRGLLLPMPCEAFPARARPGSCVPHARGYLERSSLSSHTCTYLWLDLCNKRVSVQMRSVGIGSSSVRDSAPVATSSATTTPQMALIFMVLSPAVRSVSATCWSPQDVSVTPFELFAGLSSQSSRTGDNNSLTNVFNVAHKIKVVKGSSSMAPRRAPCMGRPTAGTYKQSSPEHSPRGVT